MKTIQAVSILKRRYVLEWPAFKKPLHVCIRCLFIREVSYCISLSLSLYRHTQNILKHGKYPASFALNKLVALIVI